jgi:DNA invertase Pin-like site-specific DNA recombinase
MKGQKIGYIRVSTVEQNTTRQLDGLELDRIFTDKCSGKDTNRPELANLLNFIRDGDTLIVHSMDRLARNLDDLRKLVDKITSKNITVQFVKESLIFAIDDKNPIGKLMLSVMGAFAEFERSLIKERQLEGIAIAKKANKYKGRVKALNKDQIAEMQQMIIERYKKSDIAKKFGIHYVTLYRYMKENQLTANNIIPDKLIPQKSNVPQIIQILLTFNIENNSDFVRGKKKTKEDIETFVLMYYEYEKINDCEYIITLKYDTNEELTEIIESIVSEIHSQADSRDCFVEDISVCSTDKKRYWDVY